MLDVTILNSQVLLVICGTKIFHRGFYWERRNVIDERENWGVIIHLPKEDQATEETV